MLPEGQAVFLLLPYHRTPTALEIVTDGFPPDEEGHVIPSFLYAKIHDPDREQPLLPDTTFRFSAVSFRKVFSGTKDKDHYQPFLHYG